MDWDSPHGGTGKEGVRGLLKAGPKNNKGPGWILKSVIFLWSDRLKSVIAGTVCFQSAKFALKRTVFALCGKAAPLSANPAYVPQCFGMHCVASFRVIRPTAVVCLQHIGMRQTAA